MKLQKKILLSNLLLFVFPCLLLFWLMVSLVRREGNERLNESRLMFLHQINENMEATFLNIASFSDFFFNNPEINRLLSRKSFDSAYDIVRADKQVQDYLRERWVSFREENGCFLELLGENGRNYSSLADENTNLVYPDLNRLKEEAWYQDVKETSKIHYVPAGNSEELAARPGSALWALRRLVNINSGRTIGLMNIGIRQTKMTDLLSGGSENPLRDTFLIDGDGRVISSTDSGLTGRMMDDTLCLRKLKENDHGYFQASIGGEKRQICFVTNPTTGWKIVMWENVRTGDWFTDQYLGIVTAAAVFLVLAFVMSGYNAHYISRPVRRLKNHMKTVCTGDFRVRAQVETDDEFGQLSMQFNEMIERIQYLIRQLEERDEEKRVLELQALQAQIRPHFLYNTLASIRFLMEMDMKDRAEQSLLALVRFLKSTFSEQRELIPVEEELEVLKHYLVLMANRHQDSFVWEVDMEPEAAGCLIPRFSLQPLAENSISHGLGGKQGTGHITVRAAKEGKELVIRICDDGQGADLEKINRLLGDISPVGGGKKAGSIGIRNVQQRIRLFFGADYGMTAFERKEGGLCFLIRIPARTAEDTR